MKKQEAYSTKFKRGDLVWDNYTKFFRGVLKIDGHMYKLSGGSSCWVHERFLELAKPIKVKYKIVAEYGTSVKVVNGTIIPKNHCIIKGKFVRAVFKESYIC